MPDWGVRDWWLAAKETKNSKKKYKVKIKWFYCGSIKIIMKEYNKSSCKLKTNSDGNIS